jgi:O-antigen/teichoic acid export membrane protein
VGKKYSTAELAYYNKGQQFPGVISSTLDAAVQSVMLPVMSRVQHSKEALNDYLVRGVVLSSLVVAPAMLGLAAVVETLFPFLLTEKWNQSIPLAYVFCIADLSVPIRTPNLSLIMATGRSDLYMKLELLRRIVMLVVLLPSIFCFNSIMAIAIGFLISSLIDTYIIVEWVKRISGLGLLAQIAKLWKIYLAGFVMAGIVYLMNGLMVHPGILLVLQVAVGIAVYVGMLMLLKERMCIEAIAMLKRIRNKQSEKANIE